MSKVRALWEHSSSAVLRSLPKLAVAAAASAAVTLAAPREADALYLYLPDLLVVSTGDDADAWLEDAEYSLGVDWASDPADADRPDLARLNRTVRVMERHWEKLDAACDPNAVFALMYLHTTYNIRNHIEQSYFADNDYLSVITVAFAQLYLDAWDRWVAGEAGVPVPWQEAFDYGSSGWSSIIEDELLGMNAHINYDLAVATASLGTRDASGNSRKPDMDRVNHVLQDATDDVGYFVALHYGPKAPTGQPSSGHEPPDSTSALILEPVYVWREAAWNNANLIEACADIGCRELQDASMQTHGWTVAQGFKSPKLTSPAQERRDYCMTHP